ncbi:MAG: HIT family protein [Rhodothermales bacterium]|nr:HIT family protein [Rhodothermales bacterium]
MDKCIFCSLEQKDLVGSNNYCSAFWDAYPVTPLHALVVPPRHVRDYFDLTQDELLASDALIKEICSLVRPTDSSVAGFNIGVNIGETAGQSVFHCHFHIIPRRVGDQVNPRGGIRNIFPGKGDY